LDEFGEGDFEEWFAGLLVCWFAGLLVCWFAGLERANRESENGH